MLSPELSLSLSRTLFFLLLICFTMYVFFRYQQESFVSTRIYRPFYLNVPGWPSARNTAFVGYIYNDVYSVDLYVSLEIYSFCSFKNT